MAYPVKIELHQAALSPRAKARIEAMAGDLETFFPRILSCTVHVEGPGGHHRQGEFAVRINLAVPTRTIVVNRQRKAALDEALAASFDAAARRLEDHARRIRGDVKRHAVS